MRLPFYRALLRDFFLLSASNNSIRLECYAFYYYGSPRFENLLFILGPAFFIKLLLWAAAAANSSYAC